MDAKQTGSFTFNIDDMLTMHDSRNILINLIRIDTTIVALRGLTSGTRYMKVRSFSFASFN